MKNITWVLLLFGLTSCSEEHEVKLENTVSLPASTVVVQDNEVSNPKYSKSEKTKAYFISVHVLRKNETFNPKIHTDNVSYFYESADTDIPKSFLHHWEKNPDLVIDFDQYKATSKSKNLDYYVMKEVEEIPADQAWLYRETE